MKKRLLGIIYGLGVYGAISRLLPVALVMLPKRI
jgi:hypothetical protein